MRALRGCIVFWLVVVGVRLGAEPPEVVFVFIGDGMGFEQVEAARCYAGAPLCFELLPYQAECTTYSANASVTDSAAAGTALATAVKVNNGVISMAYPGDGSELETLLEDSRALGKMVGLVTTTYLTHATPAAFGAHEPSRSNLSNIAADYLGQTVPNVLFGGGGNGLSVSATESAGYAVATDSESFLQLDPNGSWASAQFGSSHLPYEYDYLKLTYPYPHLSEMVTKAIDVLDQDPDGLFIMVEGGRIDHACHDNKLERAVHETIEFANAVQVALDWAAGRTDTLILVTADHETGGLTVTQDNGPGNYPTVRWGTGSHTAANVPVYAWGQNAPLVFGVMDNTDMLEVCTADTAVPQATGPWPHDGALDVPLDETLSWIAGNGAVSHEVYFWDAEASPPSDPVITTECFYGPGGLSGATEYLWRVDEVDGSGAITTGAVWSFTTLDPDEPPEPISEPDPADLATDVPLDVVLTWTAGARAESHDVYFGTDPAALGTPERRVESAFLPPQPLEYGTTYFWQVDEVRIGSEGQEIVTAGTVLSFTTAAPPVIHSWLATGERTNKGLLAAGDYTSTFASDDTYEVLQESINVANKNGYSVLDHTWTIDVGDGSVAELYVEAYRSESADGDDFVLSYSEDGELFTTMLEISKTVDTDTAQVYKFPGGISGTLWIRVQDSDHSKGAQAIDTLYVDSLSILTSSDSIVHYEASRPFPATGAEDVVDSEDNPLSLTWTAGEDALKHNVYFADDREYLALVSEGQSGTTYDPEGELSPLTTYYWRVDEVREGGLVTEGDVWLFTTTYTGSCVPSSMEVQSIVTSTVRGTAGQKFGVATVTVVDNCGNAVEGATVYGQFVGDFDDVVSDTTNSAGVVVFETSTEVKKPSFGFLVTDVTHDTLPY